VDRSPKEKNRGGARNEPSPARPRGTNDVLRDKNRHRDAAPARNPACAASPRTTRRYVRPREVPPHVPLDSDDDEGGERDFYEEDVGPPWDVGVADDDDDDISEALARSTAKRKQARRAATCSHGTGKTVPEDDAVEDDDNEPEDQEDQDEDAHDEDDEDEQARGVVPLTADEVARRAKRDARIWKRLGTAAQDRLRSITDLTELASPPCYLIACYGAALRLVVERRYDAHGELCHAEHTDTRRQRRAQLKESAAAVAAANEHVAAFNQWVAANRPELANDTILELLAGSKEQRAEAKTRLTAYDRKYTATKTKSKEKGAKGEKGGSAFPLPLMYRPEYQGKVRAYPGWVAPVLRKVAKKRGHNIPAMAFVISQLAYWSKPKDDTGEPRARRSRKIAGKWWIVLGYGEIEKQTPVSKGQAREAMKHLKALNLVETVTPGKAGVGTTAGGVNYGPNTVFLRLNAAVLEPLIKEVMSE